MYIDYLMNFASLYRRTLNYVSANFSLGLVFA